MQKQEAAEMNIHQKILKIADMAGVLRKSREGYGYKYTPEDEIQAKITAGMQKYRVNLMPSIVPGTLEVIPYRYEKAKTKKVKNEKTNKDEIVDYTIPVYEIIVKAEVEYIWINADRPEERIICRWAYVGQMDDAAQAMGAGLTYGNRYYLLKALQLATTEDDPDEYRSKQKAAENYEEEKETKRLAEELQKAIKEVSAAGTQLIKLGATGVDLHKIVAKHNGGNENISSIKTVEICNKIKEEFENFKATLKGNKKETKK